MSPAIPGEEPYAGDDKLNLLLKRAKCPLDADQVRDLIAGVLAAPDGAEPDAWLSLVCARAPKALVQQVTALKGLLAGEQSDHGLDGRRSHPERLEALRVELINRHLDGFVIPRGDEHQGESVARRSERLAWLTGFTGSAGTAIVLVQRAALFIDGRYTLQAAQEVDDGLYEILNVEDITPSEWIAQNLTDGRTLGIDPWLHTGDQARILSRSCQRAGATLTEVAENPVDAIWRNRPPAPVAPVAAHSKAYAGEGSREKRRRLTVELIASGATCQVLTAPDSIAWLLNVRGGDIPFTPVTLSFALLHDDSSVDWFVDPRKLPPKIAKHLGDDVRPLPIEAFGPALDSLAKEKKTVRFDPATVPQWVGARLKAAGIKTVLGADPCQLAKAMKNATEIGGMRASHLRDGAAICRFLAWLSKTATDRKVTEIQAAETLEAFRRETELYRGPSFETISGAGSNGAIVHYRVTPETNRRLKSGSLYLVDSGGQYLDGTTDITRTIAIGPPKREMRARFTRVLKGHIAIARAIFPDGTTGAQLDPLARQPLWDVGLDYDHGTGHGVGCYLGVHEGPQRIAKRPSAVKLVPGMVLSNEPGYYKTGAYGIRIENLVLVTDVERPIGGERRMLGFETLTLAPIDRSLILPDLLNDAELAWINDYHQRVGRELKPLVDKKTRGWLKHATRRLKR